MGSCMSSTESKSETAPPAARNATSSDRNKTQLAADVEKAEKRATDQLSSAKSQATTEAKNAESGATAQLSSEKTKFAAGVKIAETDGTTQASTDEAKVLSYGNHAEDGATAELSSEKTKFAADVKSAETDSTAHSNIGTDNAEKDVTDQLSSAKSHATSDAKNVVEHASGQASARESHFANDSKSYAEVVAESAPSAHGLNSESNAGSAGLLSSAAGVVATGNAVVSPANFTGTDSEPAIVYVLIYSTYGHVASMSDEFVKGVEEAGASAKLFYVPESLDVGTLESMHAAPRRAGIPVATPDDLAKADALAFGVPTRFGMPAAQVKHLLDSTGQLWSRGALLGKPGTVFFSTGSIGGGQESTAWTMYTQFVHHGMLILPIGYSNSKLFDMNELHGGSPYGAGTFAGADGSRQPTELERDVARSHGKYFATVASQIKCGRKLLEVEASAKNASKSA